MRARLGNWSRGTGPRRVVLAVVLLAMISAPLPSAASGGQPAARAAPQQGSAPRWAARLPGQWIVGAGAVGTVPASGQAYVAVGGGLAVVGDGLDVTAYRLSDGARLWQSALDAPAGSKIMSVRAWPGAVTVGVTGPVPGGAAGATRTETVLSAAAGRELGRYPAALFGGTVWTGPGAVTVIGDTAVTSYDTASGRVRWRRAIAGGPWRADGTTLYVARQAGGPLGPGPVTGLQVINVDSGAERTMASPGGHPFPGTLTAATSGTVLFTSAAGVTAYSASTGGELWSAADAVPEGSDPGTGLVYLTARDGALTGVNPVTGRVATSVPGSATTGSAAMYVVRGGVALGLDSGDGGQAWGYSVTGGRVTWTVPNLPWPHFFADLSGAGGSASASSDTVVISACPMPSQTAPAATAGQSCADPELIALGV